MSQLAPYALDWHEVDPALHPFDSSSVEEVVHVLGPAGRVPVRPRVPFADAVMTAWTRDKAQPWADAMSRALVLHYGRWVAGWRWSNDEGDVGGGPVSHWCCPRDSVSTPDETLDRVVAAVTEWRDWLESLAGRFEAYPLVLADVEDQRILWECAARNLIIQVTDRTGCGSGWYGHCRQVLTWFLTHWGVAPDVAGELVDKAIGGRFLSWTGPDTALVTDVAERLSLSLRSDDGERPTARRPDHLREWLTVRGTVPWPAAPDTRTDGPAPPSRDGAAEDIRTFDAAVDPARADGMLAALALVRADAARGATLDFELLRAWQRRVLATPEPPPFRTLPAFAKGGRERYGIDAGTRDRLDACLAGSTADGGRPLPLAARAARAFLDVCFFHPFDDGNARAAFLTLVFVLAREGAAVESVRLFRAFTFRADDPQDAVYLAGVLDRQLPESRRTSAPAGA
ncbi:Fic family protein [Streptomyces sp. NBC_00178]|uniref:cell filamentation protein Fic n=1 Tax=Streptomyces sp. NBC_00178 TaxID=2975672 RepID=UPI002E286AAE|nr:cell filamentation protein Fic [Streptomyces sp. NBC_00178]